MLHPHFRDPEHATAMAANVNCVECGARYIPRSNGTSYFIRCELDPSHTGMEVHKHKNKVNKHCICSHNHNGWKLHGCNNCACQLKVRCYCAEAERVVYMELTGHDD